MADSVLNMGGTWQKDLKRLAGSMATWNNKLRSLEPLVAAQTAEMVAAIYRKKLRRGVGDQLSPITRIIKGDMPPLAGLADHVIVRRTRTSSTVTFDQSGRTNWARVAFMLDRGYFIKPTDAMRRALFAQIAEATGLPGGTFINESSGGVWLVPARPHLHLLTGPEMERMLLKVARFVVANGRLPNLSSQRPEAVPFVPDRELDITSIQFKLGNEGLVQTGRTSPRLGSSSGS